jgi:hypothetical protein
VPSDKWPLVGCVASLIVTLVLTRAYTRIGRRRGWGSAKVAGGVHLHHMAVGILVLLATGLLMVAFWPTGGTRTSLAIAFGIGAGLTLDEFALWLYLRDVYWTPEGRRSVDAMLIAVLIGGLLIFGASPFGIADADTVPRVVALIVITTHLFIAVVVFLKGKHGLGMLSIFLPLLGVVGVIRLAKPTSLWARWFYKPSGAKVARARRRYSETAKRTRYWNRVEDVVGGSPNLGRPDVTVNPPASDTSLMRPRAATDET